MPQQPNPKAGAAPTPPKSTLSDKPVKGTVNPSASKPLEEAKPSVPLDSAPGPNQPSTPPPGLTSPTKAPPPLSSPPPSKSAPSVGPAPIKSSPFRFLIPVVAVLLLILAGVFAFSRFRPYLAGLLPGGNAEPDPVEIIYWGLWEPNQVMEQVFQEFETTFPNVNITYQQQSQRDYRERLQNALNSGSGPDVFRYHNTWVPMLQANLAVVPSDIISTTTYEQTFYPVAATWLKSSKGLVGIPLEFDGLGLYYNTQILEAAGKSPPTTWDELRRTAKQVTVVEAGTILRGGVALGTTNNIDHWSDVVGLMLIQNAANPEKPNNQLGQDAITFYTLFNTVDQVWDETMPESTLAFATEKAVMMLAPSWRAHEVADINPNLSFRIAPAPKLPDTDATWASFWVEGVSTQSSRDKQMAAWQLIEFLSQKETLRRFYQHASSSPGRLFGEPFSRVDLADQLTGDPYVGAYIKQAPSAKSWFLSSRTFDNGLNDQIIKYYEDAINAVRQGEDAADALVATEQGITQVFSRFNLR